MSSFSATSNCLQTSSVVRLLPTSRLARSEGAAKAKASPFWCTAARTSCPAEHSSSTHSVIAHKQGPHLSPNQTCRPDASSSCRRAVLANANAAPSRRTAQRTKFRSACEQYATCLTDSSSGLKPWTFDHLFPKKLLEVTCSLQP